MNVNLGTVCYEVIYTDVYWLLINIVNHNVDNMLVLLNEQIDPSPNG